MSRVGAWSLSTLLYAPTSGLSARHVAWQNREHCCTCHTCLLLVVNASLAEHCFSMTGLLSDLGHCPAFSDPTSLSTPLLLLQPQALYLYISPPLGAEQTLLAWQRFSEPKERLTRYCTALDTLAMCAAQCVSASWRTVGSLPNALHSTVAAIPWHCPELVL